MRAHQTGISVTRTVEQHVTKFVCDGAFQQLGEHQVLQSVWIDASDQPTDHLPRSTGTQENQLTSVLSRERHPSNRVLTRQVLWKRVVIGLHDDDACASLVSVFHRADVHAENSPDRLHFRHHHPGDLWLQRQFRREHETDDDR